MAALRKPHPRLLTQRLLLAARDFPVVTVTGPRQSGKSTLCRMAFPKKPYVNLEALDERAFATRDPRAFLAQFPHGAILDEIQRTPDLTTYLQVDVDEVRKAGRWILSGSQYGLLTGAVSQSLAGRNALLELLPLCVTEQANFPHRGKTLWDYVVRGGFPAIAAKPVDPSAWLLNYVVTYLERDVRDIRAISDFSAFRTFLRLAAGRTAHLLNLATLGADAGVSQPTAKSWISVLEATYAITRIQPFFVNIRKRLVKSPKLHFIDTGLACALLGIHDAKTLDAHPSRGPLFESFIASECLKLIQAYAPTATLGYYRDQHGEEADLVVQLANRTLVIEVKSGTTIASDWDRRLQAIARRLGEGGLPDPTCVVIYGGTNERTIDGTRYLPWNAVHMLFEKRTARTRK